MGRIKGRTRAGTRHAILKSAEWTFAHHGVEGSSLALVGERAGVTAASICYHFGHKAGLREAVMDALYARLGGLVSSLDDDATLGEWISVVMDFSMTHRDGLRLILRHIMETGGLGRATREDRMSPLLDVLSVRLGARFSAPPENARRALVSGTHLLMRFVTNEPEDNRVALGLGRVDEVRAEVEGILLSVARHLLVTPIHGTPAAAGQHKEP